MKKSFIILTVFITLCSVAFGQERIDVIYFKNSDIVKGIIIENVPNNYVRIELQGGSILTYKYAEIEKFTKELPTIGAFSQNYSVDKGAIIISGMASFTSLGYEDADNRITTFALVPMLLYFVVPNVFLGGALEFNKTSYGDDSQSSFAFGPSLGYAIGNENSTVFPYIGVGFRYRTTSETEEWWGEIDTYKTSGTDIIIGGGIIIPTKKHIGIIIEAGYHIMSTKPKGADESYSSNLFGIGIGFAGLIF